MQIDRDGAFIGMRYPYELNIVADAGAALRALIPRLERKADRSWRRMIEKNVARWWETMQRQAMTDSDLPGVVNPLRLVWELSEQLALNAMVAADSGSSANWYARHLRFRGQMRDTLSGTLATMGPGVPYVPARSRSIAARPRATFASTSLRPAASSATRSRSRASRCS